VVKPDLSVKRLVKIAQSIRDRLVALRATRYERIHTQLRDTLGTLDQMKWLDRSIRMCAERGWDRSASRLVYRVERLLPDQRYMIDRIGQTIESCRIEIPPLRDIVAELEAAQQEFGQLNWCSKTGCVSVVTEPIELEGVELGEFEIMLEINRLADMDRDVPYRVVALDPHLAAGNESVTHPHVSDGRLCTGDASAAIRAALTTGRISDLFVLVRSVLTTYNPNSPYIRLEDWDGRPCHDCGCMMDEDDYYICERCEERFCSECSSYCRRCDASMCHGCLSVCAACDDLYCENCFQSCAECGERFCEGCLEGCASCGELLCSGCLDDDGMCPGCAKSQEDQDGDPDDGQDRVDGHSEEKGPEPIGPEIVRQAQRVGAIPA